LYGYLGKIARIDLTSGKVWTEALKEDFARQYIGGKGFGAKILYEELTPKADPYEPSNLLIFATGPVNSLILSGASKLCAVFKSPLTGGWGESQCGGHFAPQLKYAGYDMLIITGKSEKPVYVTIEDEEIRVWDATHLWGEDTFQTEETIKKDHGKGFQVISIGKAGENLVRYACITHDRGRQFGRAGAGAVMGSKKLKAIAVKGGGKIDELDSQWLARIFSAGLVKPSYIPEKKIMELRNLTRLRVSLLEAQTAFENRAHKILQICNIRLASKLYNYSEKMGKCS